MESWEVGYVNEENLQVNLGKLERGIYRLHCIVCGETYGAPRVADIRCTNPWCEIHTGRAGWGQSNYALTPEERPDDLEGRRQLAIAILAAELARVHTRQAGGS